MNLSKLFDPGSVAVVGASREPSKLGAIVLRNIQESGFGGKIYPVNPKAESINGLECFSKYEEIPDVPDLAVIAIPVKFVLDVVEEIGNKGTKAAVVISAGFGETGEEGRDRENKLIEIAQKHGMAVLGPNCLGFVNNLNPINATFGQLVKNPGNLRFVSQSGAIASSIFDWFEVNGLGYSEFVTLGNKAVVSENEVLEYFLAQSRQDVAERFGEGLSKVYPVGMYLESIVDGERFVELVSKTSMQDPVFVLKPGKSEAASKAMRSHTGAMAGSDKVFEAAVRKAGAIRCEGIEDMFDMARAFSWEDAPDGSSVAVISNAGGPAVISADVVSEVGLSLATIDDGTHERLLEVLPREASAMNPIDVLGDALAERYRDAMEIVLQEEKIHALVVILTPQVMTQIQKTAEYVGQMSLKYGKPIMCSFMGGSHIVVGEQVLNEYKIPSFRYPERAIQALGKMWQWQSWRREQRKMMEGGIVPVTGIDDYRIGQVIERVVMDERNVLGSREAHEILEAAQIKVPQMVEVGDGEQIKGMAAGMGFPVVLKFSSPKLLHKTEVGGVWSNIYDEEELVKAFREMRGRIDRLDEEVKSVTKLVLQKQVEKGVEVICGVKRDENFGPVLMFGTGGVLAELVHDSNLGVLPLKREQIKTLVGKTKIVKMLEGWRGEQGYDLNQVYDLLVKLSKVVVDFEGIAEMEINPVIVNREGVWAVDGKVVLR